MCQDAPDFQPLADALRDATAKSHELGQNQLALHQQMYDEMAPVTREIYSAQRDAMNQQMAQAKDYYDYNVNTFRPIEKGIVADAANFNTDAYREGLASQAAADAGLAFSRTRQANERAMRSMGVNPNSGAAVAANAQANLGLAANRAAAMTGTRMQADQLGYARKLDAAGLGRNLPGASTAAYGSATNAGTAGAGVAANFMNASNAGMAYGTNTIMQGQQLNVQGISDMLNSQAQFAGQTNAGIGAAFGGIAGGLTGRYSDRRMKENITFVGTDETSGFNLYDFNYVGDDKRYRGVMADEVYMSRPDAVSHDERGFMRVNYDAIGVQMQEVA